jgi:maleylpyruvate isomerase
VPGRIDQVSDPELRAQLLLARRGQAYYSRKLNELSDHDLNDQSGLEGWSRRHVAAHVGLNARALTHLTQWAATGVESLMYASPTQRTDDIEFAATLPGGALRNLSDHAAIHLNVEWRDLPADRWSFVIRTAQGREVPVSETVWMRTREVWIHAVDLANGASFHDFPPAVLDQLLLDVTASWRHRRASEELATFLLEPTDRVDPVNPEDRVAGASAVRGLSADLARWATGRGSSFGLSISGPNRVAPRWL